ncbi:MAG TPA: tetratricopeptide repeat protein [Pyrinomonadaceae bacterium]|jgi:tetratricopeptide (TPR) repeat protein/serine/threonine protein kinase
MTPERWKQIEEVFQAALDLPEGERRSFIAKTCGGDDELCREVEVLISQYAEAGDFIETPPLAGTVLDPATTDSHQTWLMNDFDDPSIGRRIGAYRIIREIGRGGMGAVYLAERADSEFRKRVAIKLIKRGMDTDFILRRFRNERQILATLDHPNIARLLDGGTTDDGLPYFVMEHIEGLPIYRFCDERRLTIHERLRLFRPLCDAVHYAHRNLVIHRDIKPSNILVIADGVPKLLDFGIAKLLNPELAADITLDPTATAMRLMTPEYASPEQVQGLVATPATDVYSLGVLLYELLTGHRPYRLRNRAPHEIARVICEEEPAHPSIVITRPDDLLSMPPRGGETTTLEHLYGSRGSTVEALRRDLAGDLDNIVMKALRKEPELRYASAEELRDDITLYLEGRTVSAPLYMPAAMRDAAHGATDAPADENSLAVLPFKLLDVHRGGDTGDDYLGVGLADTLITRLSQLRRFVVRPTSSVARYGGDTDSLAAGRELSVAFVLDGRIRRSGESIRVTVQLLDVDNGASVWAGQFDEKFTDVLSLEDAISSQVAGAIVPHLTHEERRQLSKRGTDNPDAYEAYMRGRYYWNTFTEEGLAKALLCYNRAVACAPDYALAYTGIADYYNWLGIYAVLPFAETSAAAKEAALKAVALDDSLAEAYSALGFATLMHDFDWETTGRHLRRALELNPNYVTGRLWYCYFLGMSGRFDEALAQVREAVELDPLTPFVQQTLSWIYYHARRYDESVAAARKVSAYEPRYGLTHVFLGQVLWRQTGEFEEAIEAGQKAIELLGRSPYTLIWLASTYAAAARRDEALTLLEEIERMSAVRYVSPYLLAMVYCYLGDHERAFAELERAWEIRDGRLTWLGVDPNFDRLRGDPRLADLLRRTNNPTVERVHADNVTGVKSVAVLPFKLFNPVKGDDTGDEYLGVGLADALIARLSAVRRIVVRPTSSVLRYRSDADPLAAGREMGVDYIIDGTIRRAGATLRVSAQLLSVVEGATRWAGKFDEKLTDVLQIEDSISEQVARALVLHLTTDEHRQLGKRGTDNPDAYEAYMRGRYYWSEFTEEGFIRALDSYNRAIELDPSYAAAYSGIADYYNWLGVYGIRPFAECAAAARQAAQQAVELDDTSAEAYSALGFAVITHDFDWTNAEAQHRRAIEINPNYATAHQWYSFHLQMEGRFDQAIAEMRRASELDPLTPSILQSLGWCYYQARRYDESLATYRTMLDAVPNFAYGLSSYAWTLRQVGKYTEAVAAAEKAVELSSDSQFFLNGLAASLASAGRHADARQTLAKLREMRSRRYVSPYHLSLVHLWLGEREQSLALLREAYDIRDGWLVWLGVEPQFDSLRGDPLFEDILKKTGNPLLTRRAASSASRRASVSGNLSPTPRLKDTTASSGVAAAGNTSTAEKPKHTVNEEAHQLYVAGHYFASRRTADGLRQAIQRLERAVELDPGYSLAYAELADCHALLNWYVEPPPAGAFERAKQAALKAVEADPGLADAHASLGFVKLHYDRDWEGAEREFRYAIELQPENTVSHRWYAFTLSALGRHDEAIAQIKRAQELSPRSPVTATAVANVLFFAQRFDEAIEQCRRALELDPGSLSTHIVLRWSYERKGMHDEALAVNEQERAFVGDTPTTRAKRAHVLASCGRVDEAREILNDIIQRRDEQWVTAYEIAVIFALLGEHEEAFKWLTQAEKENAVGLTYIRVDPRIDSLRHDPRFDDMIQRMNTPTR